jgi:hypothetical protein
MAAGKFPPFGKFRRMIPANGLSFKSVSILDIGEMFEFGGKIDYEKDISNCVDYDLHVWSGWMYSI